MKKKHFLVSFLALCLMTGSLFGAGVLAKNEAKVQAIEAANEQTVYLDPTLDLGDFHWNDASAKFAIYAFGDGEGNNCWSSFMEDANEIRTGLKKTTIDLSDKTHIIFVRVDPTESSPTFSWNQTIDLPIDAMGDKNLFQINSTKQGEKYECNWERVSTVTLNYATKGTQTKLVTSLDVYSAPTEVGSTWFVDAEFNTAYLNQTIRVDTTLYEKFRNPENPAHWDYVYVAFEGDAWSEGVYVYTYIKSNEEGKHSRPGSNGAWPGRRVEVTSRTCFTKHEERNAGLAKIPYALGADTHMVINNGKEGENLVQSNDLLITEGHGYGAWDAAEWGGDSNWGKAASVVFALDKLMDSPEHNSICNIELSKAVSLLNSYKTLSGDAKAMADAATIWTYRTGQLYINDEDINKADVSVFDIMAQLSLMYENNAPELMNHSLLANGTNSIGLVVILSIAGFVTLFGVFYFIRRRKQQ